MEYIQLPNMNAFPDERSVLILDNCRIHHNDTLVELLEGSGELLQSFLSTNTLYDVGCIIKYLPPYSPDLTPIEESFSCCTCPYVFLGPH